MVIFIFYFQPQRSFSLESAEVTNEKPPSSGHTRRFSGSNPRSNNKNEKIDGNPESIETGYGSDVKPDVKNFQNDTDADFMSRMTKGSKRLFIEEFPEARSDGNNFRQIMY